jgi:hypothetical protein
VLTAIGVGAAVNILLGCVPIVPAVLTLALWNQTVDEHKTRLAEYQLHRKIFPNIPSLLFALHQGGASIEELIGAYDGLVEVIGRRIVSNREVPASEVRQFLEGKILEFRSNNGNVFETMPDGSFETAGELPQTELQEPIASAAAAPTVLGGSVAPIVPGVAAAPSMVNSKVLCPIDVIGRDPYQSIGCIGGQRTGKTWTAALHTQNVKRSRGAKIIYINLIDANGDAEKDWEHADVVVTCHLRKLSDGKARAVIEKVISIVNEFFDGVNQILVFDEWVGFTSRSNQWTKKAAKEASEAAFYSKEAKQLIEPEGLGTSAVELMNLMMGIVGELTESGKKQSKAVWLISPKVKAESIELQGKIIKDLSPMAVVISRGKTVSWTHPTTHQTQDIGFDDAGYRASMQNMGLPPIESIPTLDCTRMMFYNGTWYNLDNAPKLAQSSASPEPSTWVGEGRSDVPPEESEWDSLMTAIAVQAMVASGLDQKILIEAAQNARRFHNQGNSEKALELLRRQVKP